MHYYLPAPDNLSYQDPLYYRWARLKKQAWEQMSWHFYWHLCQPPSVLSAVKCHRWWNLRLPLPKQAQCDDTCKPTRATFCWTNSASTMAKFWIPTRFWKSTEVRTEKRFAKSTLTCRGDTTPMWSCTRIFCREVGTCVHVYNCLVAEHWMLELRFSLSNSIHCLVLVSHLSHLVSPICPLWKSNWPFQTKLQLYQLSNNLDDVRDQWERIKLAYEILKDKRMRKRYDRHEAISDPKAALKRAATDAAGNAAKEVGKGIFNVGKGLFNMGAKAVSDSMKKDKDDKAWPKWPTMYLPITAHEVKHDLVE